MEDRRMKAVEDVVRAWMETGSDPDYSAKQHDAVRTAMPMLAKSLDALVAELKGGYRVER